MYYNFPTITEGRIALAEPDLDEIAPSMWGYRGIGDYEHMRKSVNHARAQALNAIPLNIFPIWC